MPSKKRRRSNNANFLLGESQRILDRVEESQAIKVKNSRCFTSAPLDFEDRLSDETWIQIIHFVYGSNVCAFNGTSNKIFSVSKYFRDIFVKFVQSIPLNLSSWELAENVSNEFYYRIAWACRQKIKIGSFRVHHHECSSIWIRIMIHLFQQCNISELETLDISAIEHMSQFHTSQSFISRLKIPGLSKKKLMKAYLNDIGHVTYLHASLSNVLAEHINTQDSYVKKLCISIEKEMWPHTLLEVLSESLEELTISIVNNKIISLNDERGETGFVRNSNGLDDIMSMQALTCAIENMPNLKKLNLRVELNTTTQQHLLQIRSKSLEVLDVTGIDNSGGFQITHCKFPSLKLLRLGFDSRLDIQGNWCIRQVSPFPGFKNFENALTLENGGCIMTVNSGSHNFKELEGSPTFCVELVSRKDIDMIDMICDLVCKGILRPKDD